MEEEIKSPPSGGKYTDKAITETGEKKQNVNDEQSNNKQPSNKKVKPTNPQEYLKNRLLAKNKAYQKYLEMKAAYQKSKFAFSFLGRIISAIGSFLVSPLGFSLVTIILAGWVISSTALIMGPQRFGSICEANGAPQIELIDKEKQAGTVANYFNYGGSISKGASAYLANMASTKTGTDFTQSTGIPEGCNTQCIYDKMLAGEIDMSKLKLGAFNLQREDAAQLITTAIREGKEWTNSSTQLAYLQKMVAGSAVTKDSKINSEEDEDLADAIRQINSTIGISLSEAQIAKEVEAAKETKDSIKGKAESCKPMGDGSCAGRMDGGDAGCTKKGKGSGSGEVGGGDISVLEEVLDTQVDMDGAYGGQCWDLTNFYLQKLGSKGIAGQSGRAGMIGHEFKGQLESEGFEVILDPSLSDIKPGDVVNTRPGRGFSDPYYGHTGIVGEVKADGSFIVYEQNAEKGQIVAKYERRFAEGDIASIVRKN